MNSTFRVTLVHLTADASAVAPASERLDLANQTVEDIVRLAGRLLKVDASAHPKTEPGILIHRNDKSYRLAAHQGRLRLHKSVSLFDDFWTVDHAEDLAGLPPFTHSASSASRPPMRTRGAAKGGSSTLRSVAEVAGLFAVAVILVAVGLRFGFPQKRLSDVPDDVVIVSGADEKAAVFAAVAGSYSTGKTAGNSLVTIRPDGQVFLGTIGKDGKASTPRITEQARAGRRGSIACVVTSFGVIAGVQPPDAVNVGRFQYRKAPVAIQ